MTSEIVSTTLPDYQPIIDLVINSLDSVHSKSAYSKALIDFLDWWEEQGRPGLTKALVQEYKTVLQSLAYSSSTINLRLSAIRRLATEASDNNLLDQTLANGIGKVKGVTSHGVRTGNWLNKDQAAELIKSPDTSKLSGLRDRAILAIMIGAGLRRSEVSKLTFDDIQQRDGRWVIVDLVSKGNRVRSVPIPPFCKMYIDTWAEAAEISGGRIFRAVPKGDKHCIGKGVTSQAVYDVVEKYATVLDIPLAAHDLRRTYAKLARRGGSDLEQIQLSLGHASIQTTERYLGIDQDLSDAPADHLGLDLNEG